MIEDIIQREWEFFQQVQNIDGRASCQDDFETFYLQRKSQFEVFPPDLQQSYLNDLIEAKNVGRNPVMEKYAYMMESTDPSYYQTIKDSLPKIDDMQLQMIDTMCRIEVEMREEFNEQYPYLSQNARYTHTSEDEIDDASFETYLRGELKTYSMETLSLYGIMLIYKYKHQQNLITEIMTRTVKAYGYESLEDAERKLKGNS